MGLLSDDVLGDRRSAVVVVTEHDDVDVELLRALDDDVRGVVLGRLDHLAMHVDPGGGELVDRVLHDLALPDVDVVLGGSDPNPDPALMSVGMMCPRATCSRCTLPPVI